MIILLTICDVVISAIAWIVTVYNAFGG